MVSGQKDANVNRRTRENPAVEHYVWLLSVEMFAVGAVCSSCVPFMSKCLTGGKAAKKQAINWYMASNIESSFGKII